MDFDHAIAAHTKWKRKIRAQLADRPRSLSPDEISLDHKCTLGSWIYGNGTTYRLRPEYVKLKYEHTRLHLVAADLVRRSNTGESVAAELAPCASSEFSASSTAVIMAMVAMKKALSD
jgi:hypothetical protein